MVAIKDFLLKIFGGYKGVVLTQISLYNKGKRVAPELPEDDLLNELIVSRIRTRLRGAAKEEEYIHYRPLLENPHKTLKDVIWAIIEYEVFEVLGVTNVDELEVKNYIDESIEKKVKKTGKATTGRPLYITENLEKPFKAGQITQTLTCGADLVDYKWGVGQIVDVKTEKRKRLGRVKITFVRPVTIEELTPKDAEMEGCSSVDQLKHKEAYFLRFVEKPQTGELYRISFVLLEDTQ